MDAIQAVVIGRTDERGLPGLKISARTMISAALLRQYSAQSRSFILHLADGRKIRVAHGDHISVQPEGRVFLLWRPKGDVEFINLTMVTSLRGSRLSEHAAE